MGIQYRYPKAVTEIVAAKGQLTGLTCGGVLDTIETVIQRFYSERGLEQQPGDAVLYKNVERGSKVISWPSGYVLGYWREKKGAWSG